MDPISILDAPGADMISEIRDGDGNTILHKAARGKTVFELHRKFKTHEEAWKRIVNVRNKDGQTPLHISCREWDRKSAGTLIINGADVNATDMLGLTPLHCAVIVQGRMEDEAESATETITEATSLVQLLLAEGLPRNLDIHIKTFHLGATALHLAALWALPKVVELLIKNGANKHLTTWRGETALHWAFRTMREDEKNYPDRMVSDPAESHFGSSPDNSDQKDAADGKFGIARYGLDMIAAFAFTNEEDKRRELLRIAYQEEDRSMVCYSARRLFPLLPAKSKELVTLWLAMRPERFSRLKTELLREVTKEQKTNWASASRNVLDLATHHKNYEVVRWLLKSNPWTAKEKENARSYIPASLEDPTGKWKTIWEIPFLQDSWKGDENYRYPQKNNENKYTAEFQSSVINFYSSGRYTHFLHHFSNVHDLLYNGEKGPVRIMRERAKVFKETFSELDTENYDDKNLRFRWIHLPVNCIEWMKVATTTSYKDKDNNTDYFTATTQFLLQSWHELPENSDKDKYMSPTCLRKNVARGDTRQPPTPGDRAADQLALYMPYVTLAKPTDKSRECEETLRRAEVGKTRIIHRSKTLDTYHLGTADDTKARERDVQQVVYRHARNRIREYETKTGHLLETSDADIPILHVDTIVTSETHNSHDGTSLIFKNVLNYLNDNKELLGRDIIPSSVDSFVRFITSFYINTPFNLSVPFTPPLNYSEKKESLHDIFLSSIEQVNDEEDHLRRHFKDDMQNQDSGKKIKGEKEMHWSVTETVELLSEIKDIQQELNIINSVILIQSNIWDQLTNRPPDPGLFASALQDNESTNWARGRDPAQYVYRRISDLLRFAEEIEKNVESILDLKMNQLSLLQAEEAGRQGTILMVFTTVTILFTPLSFLSALFALNISVFPHSGNDLQYEPGWLFGILFGVTAGVIAIVLAYVYRESFIKKKKKAGRELSGGLKRANRWGSQKQRPKEQPPQPRHDNCVSKVLDQVQQLRKRITKNEEGLPTTTPAPPK
ncbi:hypothetical protein F4777DRAFT_580772 [Nemania sp. FL0916]|nr:hypothetical protein F4777DRAFT_580772 [Nemania sp. FL0916]